MIVMYNVRRPGDFPKGLEGSLAGRPPVPTPYHEEKKAYKSPYAVNL